MWWFLRFFVICICVYVDVVAIVAYSTARENECTVVPGTVAVVFVLMDLYLINETNMFIK